MKIPIYLFTTPSNVSMIATAISFGAWAFPSFGVLRKGFEKPAPLNPVAHPCPGGVVRTHLFCFFGWPILSGRPLMTSRKPHHRR